MTNRVLVRKDRKDPHQKSQKNHKTHHPYYSFLLAYVSFLVIFLSICLPNNFQKGTKISLPLSIFPWVPSQAWWVQGMRWGQRWPLQISNNTFLQTTLHS